MGELLHRLGQLLSGEAPLTPWDGAGMSCVLLVLLAGLGMLIAGLKTRDIPPASAHPESPPWLPGEKRDPKSPPPPSAGLRWGLERSRHQFWGRLSALFEGGLSQQHLDDIEAILYGADLGPATTRLVMEELQAQVGRGHYQLADLRQLIKGTLQKKLQPIQDRLDHSLWQFQAGEQKGIRTIMVVGVNGVGKTTTVGKLAAQLGSQGATVVVGACDTFRAAAAQQLQVWCDRAGCELVRGQPGADSSGVGYATLQRAQAVGADYCLLDTAGRLQGKTNLMAELQKNRRVLTKLDPTAPHGVVLVLDAITGQNAINQAEEFNRTLSLTGIILTKCDSSSKAGPVVAIAQKLQLPVSHVGTGEGVEDLRPFDLNQYLTAMTQ